MNLLLNWLFAIIFITALQTSLSYFMTVYGIRPDFTLIFAIYAGTAAGRTAGMTVGFFVGLFADLLNMYIFGFNTFSLFLAGMGAGGMQKKVFKDS